MAEEDILLQNIQKPKASISSTNDIDVDDRRRSSAGINHAFSQDTSGRTTRSENRVEPKIFNAVRVNSSYIPRKTISRYGIALSSMMPYRRVTTSKTEIPIDSVGCFVNATFSWVHSFRITKSMLERKNNLPFQENVTNDKFLLPKSTYADSCEVNGRR